MSSNNSNNLKRGYIDAIYKLIIYIVIFILISAGLTYLINYLLPRYGIFLATYYIYINVSLTLILGYLIVKAFSEVIYHFLKLKYPEDVARAFRNVFLVI